MAGSLEAAARGIPAGSPAGHIPKSSIYHIALHLVQAKRIAAVVLLIFETLVIT